MSVGSSSIEVINNGKNTEGAIFVFLNYNDVC